MRLLYGLIAAAGLAAPWPTPVEDTLIVRDFRFASGETLPELRIHYRTLGKADSPAVLVLHGTGGHGGGFLNQRFAGELFGTGQPLDAAKYFLILPDNIGHGKSSKPSNGLRAKFPRYGYHDMVALQEKLLEHLGVSRLRLIIGTSMGCMHAWIWGTTRPQAVQALMPLACLPHEISGRNLLWRKMTVDLIRNDPTYLNGDYAEQPYSAHSYALTVTLMGANTLALQNDGPTRAAAVALTDRTAATRRERPPDANDLIYALESSHDYNPRPHLEKVKAHVTAINFADDPINPPELRIFERETRRVKRIRAILWPQTPETRGHGTHSMPAL